MILTTNDPTSSISIDIAIFGRWFVVYSVDGISSNAFVINGSVTDEGAIINYQIQSVSFPNITTPLHAISLVDNGGILCSLFTNNTIVLVNCPVTVYIPEITTINSTHIGTTVDNLSNSRHVLFSSGLVLLLFHVILLLVVDL